MVMFKARFQPERPQAKAEPQPQPPRKASRGLLQRQQQQQPQAPREVPPIEKERGPQYPVKEPGPGNPPERAR